jgi:DNA-binding response OmpR family regulator
MKKYEVLLVEDDVTLASALKYNLEAEGYAVSYAAGVSQAEESISGRIYDLIIMDVNLPDGNGFDLCKALRETEAPDKQRSESQRTPVIFLTANDLERDVLKGYELGADDYVTKPFSLRILMKKVEALLRRTSSHGSSEVYADGLLEVDFSGMTALCGGEAIGLTPLEFRILRALTANAGNVLTRETLLEKLWDAGGDFVDAHSLTAGMSRLRGKIETAAGRKYIKTIYGMGYMWLGEGRQA